MSAAATPLAAELWVSPFGSALIQDVWAVAGMATPSAMDVDDYYSIVAVVDLCRPLLPGVLREWCKPKPPLDWEDVLQWARARLAEWSLSPLGSPRGVRL